MPRRLIFLFSGLVILFAIRGQTTKDTSSLGHLISPEFLHRLDSLQKTDNLEEWLNSCMAYEEKDNAKYITFLTKAESLIWRPCRNEKEFLARFYIPVTIGYYLKYAGNILPSIEAYERAYRLYSEDPIPGADILEYVLKPLGNNYTRLGDYERALFIQEKGLSVALNENEKEQAASFYSNLAITATGKGDLANARHYSEAGLQILKKDTSLYGLLLSELADVLFRSQQIKEAEIKMKEAIGVLHRFRNQGENTPYWLYSAYLTQGELLKEKGDLDAALRSFGEGEKIIEKYFKGQLRREKAKLLVGTGDVRKLQLQPGKAIDEYDHALSVLLPGFLPGNDTLFTAAHDLYGENTLLDALRGKSDCLNMLGKKEQALKGYLLLFVAEKKLRHEFFSTSAKRQQQKENRQWAESAIETAWQLWKATGKKEFADKVLLIAEMSKSQLLLDELTSNLQYNRIKNRDTLLDRQQQLMQAISYYEKEAVLDPAKNEQATVLKRGLQYELSLVQNQVKEKYPLLAGTMVNYSLPATDSLLQHIPAGTTAIEFFTGDKGIYIIRADKGLVYQVQKLENAATVTQEVKEFVFTYFQQGPQKMMNDPESYYKDAWRIYHSLWQGTTVSATGHYLVIPDGILGYLPFDALVTDSVYRTDLDQWPFLLKTTNLFFSYSLQTMEEQRQTDRSNTLTAGFFVSFDSAKQASLPAVKKEYSIMRDAIRGEYFSESKASLKEWLVHLPKVNLLHVSTHSFLQGAENIPVLQLSDDKFFLFELYGKTFRPQLIVLSACRTGHGMLAEGEGIISLARGFTATGAGGIVAGLWNMNDESMAAMMGGFYHHLARDKHPAESLYDAKREWLATRHEQLFKKLPYFWAGLIYVGDDQPVRVRATDRLLSMISLAALAVVFLSAIYALWRVKRASGSSL